MSRKEMTTASENRRRVFLTKRRYGRSCRFSPHRLRRTRCRCRDYLEDRRASVLTNCLDDPDITVRAATDRRTIGCVCEEGRPRQHVISASPAEIDQGGRGRRAMNSGPGCQTECAHRLRKWRIPERNLQDAVCRSNCSRFRRHDGSLSVPALAICHRRVFLRRCKSLGLHREVLRVRLEVGFADRLLAHRIASLPEVWQGIGSGDGSTGNRKREKEEASTLPTALTRSPDERPSHHLTRFSLRSLEALNHIANGLVRSH